MEYRCSTDYVLSGDKADILEVRRIIDSLVKPFVDAGTEPEKVKISLLDVVKAFGGNLDKIPHSGYLYKWSGDFATELILAVKSPDTENNKIWDMICKQYPSLSYLYCAENKVTHYYVTNEKTPHYFQQRYVLTKEDSFYDAFMEEEELFYSIQEHIGEDVSTLSEARAALRKHNKKYGDEGEFALYVYKIK